MSNTSNCDTVTAVGNYWGGCPVPSCFNGDVDASQPLCNPPQSPIRDEQDVPAPRQTLIVGVVPNPFNPTTEIQFALADPGKAVVSIYDVAGRRIRSADLGTRPAGTHSWTWDGRDEHGSTMSSGVYFVVLEAAGVVDRKKIVMLK